MANAGVRGRPITPLVLSGQEREYLEAERIRKYAAELVALAPDVMLATGAAGVAPVLHATRTVPVV
jgi:hypothetical protein